MTASRDSSNEFKQYQEKTPDYDVSIQVKQVGMFLCVSMLNTFLALKRNCVIETNRFCKQVYMCCMCVCICPEM